ncbi:MAG: hypothetical protein WD159_02080 [Patescibacteria group bacterium]
MVTTAETGISEEVYAGWRSESGHKAEENFEASLKNLGVEILKEDPDPKKAEKLTTEGRIAVRRSSAKEDFEEGIDFHLFNPLIGKTVPVDISVSKDPAVHAEKRNRELRTGVRFLPLSARNLELGARGSERDIQEVWRSVNTLLLQDALDQSRRGEVSIPASQVAKIEQKLADLQ